MNILFFSHSLKLFVLVLLLLIVHLLGLGLHFGFVA